jgi:hypothetical protein
VLKLNSSGAYQWHTFYGSNNGYDYGGGIAIDSSSNVYVTGSSPASWQGDGGANPLHAHSEGYNIFVLKLNSNGAYQWHTFYGSSNGYDYGDGIAIDGSSNVYVTGSSEASWQGDGGANPLHAHNEGNFLDIVVLKLNSSGAYQWHTFYGSGSYYTDSGSGIAIDGSGSVYVTGSSPASWQGDGGKSPLHAYSGGYGSYDIVILKLNSSGAYQWHTFYGSSSTDYGDGIAVDGSDNVYVTGISYASWQGDGGANPLHAHDGGNDIVALKLSNFISTEIVFTPNIPTGPTSGTIYDSYSYSTGGSTSNYGHSVEYQFDWKGDGSDLSPWGSATQLKTWGTVGLYNVRARARCATHTSAVSSWSEPFVVVILFEWLIFPTPYVSANWYLEGVHFTSPNEGWAVGRDFSNNEGVLLHYLNGSWIKVDPPNVSSSWGLWKAHFTSSNEGWVVGEDNENRKGVLLHYLNGSWESVTPPNVSWDWSLSAIHFTSSSEGWAVGKDNSNKKGVLLHYMNGSWTSVAPPEVSKDWELSGVHFSSPNSGRVVGSDNLNKRGVMLEYYSGSWSQRSGLSFNSSDWRFWDTNNRPWVSTAIGWDNENRRGIIALMYLWLDPPGGWNLFSPTYTSSDWYLYGLDPFGVWFVGEDIENKRGVLIFNGYNSWTSVTPPNVSLDWWLNSIYFNSENDGWAVGYNRANHKGVILRYSPETVSIPNTPIGPTSGTIGTIYTYSVGGSTSSYGHDVQYLIDWGDGTNSGWLPVGTTSSSKFWTSTGNYLVKAQARCVTDISVISGWSSILSVTISVLTETISTPTTPIGPTDGAPNNLYSYNTGGSTSSLGHSVQYFFDWGDGTNSGWLPVGTTSSSKFWTSTGNYLIKAQARCAVDTSVVSNWSGTLSVNIGQASLPDLTGQWTTLNQTCRNTLTGTKCSLKGKFTVQNIGLSDAPSSMVKFYLSSDNIYGGGDTLLKQISTGTITAGGSITGNIKFKLPTGQTASGKYVIALIDADNTVLESNEANNQVVYGPIQ